MTWACAWNKETRVARVFPAIGRAHELDDDRRCWCMPRCEPVERGVMWVHNEAETAERVEATA